MQKKSHCSVSWELIEVFLEPIPGALFLEPIGTFLESIGTFLVPGVLLQILPRVLRLLRVYTLIYKYFFLRTRIRRRIRNKSKSKTKNLLEELGLFFGI